VRQWQDQQQEQLSFEAQRQEAYQAYNAQLAAHAREQEEVQRRYEEQRVLYERLQLQYGEQQAREEHLRQREAEQGSAVQNAYEHGLADAAQATAVPIALPQPPAPPPAPPAPPTVAPPTPPLLPLPRVLAGSATGQPEPAAPRSRHLRPEGAVLLGPERVPRASDAKMNTRTFVGSEEFPGVGPNFSSYRVLFKEDMAMVELACGHLIPDRYKVNRLGSLMRGAPEAVFLSQIEIWWATNPTLDYVLDQMELVFSKRFTAIQTADLFKAKKAGNRTWSQHFLYLVALCKATGAHKSLILENMVLHATVDVRLSAALLSRWNTEFTAAGRTDYEIFACQLATWAQTIDDQGASMRSTGRNIAGAVVADGDATKHASFKCRKCLEIGHIARNCPQKGRAGAVQPKDTTPGTNSSSPGGASDNFWALAVPGQQGTGKWILDSGCSKHLVNDLSLLSNIVDCTGDDDCAMADQSTLEVIKRGQITLSADVDGSTSTITLKEVYYAPKLSHHLLLFGRFHKQGFDLVRRGEQSALVDRVDGRVVFYGDLVTNVVMVYVRAIGPGQEPPGVALAATSRDPTDDTVYAPLMDFHVRFNHVAFDTIERMAHTPGSGSRSRTTRANRALCALRASNRNRRNLSTTAVSTLPMNELLVSYAAT
jgi:hypothetical protein